GHQHAQRSDASRAHLLGEQGIDGMERGQTGQLHLLLDQRADGEGPRITLPGGVLIFDEQAEIGPIAALGRQLQEAFQSRRIVTEAVVPLGRELGLDPELQPIVEAVLELVNGSLAVADREIVLELELMALDDRAANLEITGFGPSSASDDHGRREDRTTEAVDRVPNANATHLQLLPKIRDGRGTSSPLFAGLELRIGRVSVPGPG